VYNDYDTGAPEEVTSMLRKIKYIGGTVILAAVIGAFAALNGVDYQVAFGPTVGGIVYLAVGYLTKESLPRIEQYIRDGFGTEVE
jgi:hypothetical protein